MKICKNKRLWAYTLGVHLLTLFSRCSCSVLTVSRSLVSCSRVALRSCWSLVAAWPRSLDSFFSFAKRSCSNNQEQTWHQWTKVKKKKTLWKSFTCFYKQMYSFFIIYYTYLHILFLLIHSMFYIKSSDLTHDLFILSFAALFWARWCIFILHCLVCRLHDNQVSFVRSRATVILTYFAGLKIYNRPALIHPIL